MKNLINSILCLVIIAQFSEVAVGQEKVNNKDFFVEAESYYLFEEYSDAMPLYQRILRFEPDNYNVIYKLGICYLNDAYQKQSSIDYLFRASKHINPSYKIKSYKEKQAPPEVNFYLGQAYRVDGQLKEALVYFKKFRKSVNPAVYDLKVIDDEIASCERAIRVVKSPVYYKSKNVGSGINTQFTEANAILSGDGNTMIFNRHLQFYDAVFIVYKQEDGIWSSPNNLTPNFGLDGNSYCTGISFSGDEIFVYRSDGFDGNIYSSKRDNRTWQGLIKLNSLINTKYWESHASPSSDGRFLYFTSNRKGGYGGLDIYRATRLSDNKWGEIINLGPKINSSSNEYTPFISPKDQGLYFSSRGHNSIGGYDVFVASYVSQDQWSRPVNMGYPLNTTDDDIHYCPINSDEYAGVQSLYQPESGAGLTDIYWVKVFNEVLPRVFDVKGLVMTPTPELLKEGEVFASLIKNETGKLVSRVNVSPEGNYQLKAGPGKYTLHITGEGIKQESIPVVLSLTQEDTLVELPPIQTEISDVQDELATFEPKKLPRLDLFVEDYLIIDSVPIRIDMLLDPGSTLKVETYNNNQLINTEEFLVSKEKFSYNFNPEPGDNRLYFTVTDKDGNVSVKDITVFYKLPEFEESLADGDMSPTQLPELALIAEGGLYSYLSGNGSGEVNFLVDLYETLIANIEGNDYDTNDVDNIIEILLTQRDIKEFLDAIQDIDKLEDLSSNDTLVAKASIPLSFVREGRLVKGSDGEEMSVGLIEAVPADKANSDLSSYIASFFDEPIRLGTSFKSQATADIYNSLISISDEESATKAVELASTTESLDQFYNNLLISSDESLLSLLKELNFDSLDINNSIDLVEYLLSNAEKNKQTKIDLIRSIEKSKKQKTNNILELKEALAEVSTGALKLQIQSINIQGDNIAELSDIIDFLLKKSLSAGYGKAEVYQLLLDVIGISDLDEFIKSLKAASGGRLDEVLSKINISEFSRPIELIQYLLGQASYHDYTDSYINNLLLKMLLERGLVGGEVEEGLDAVGLQQQRKQITGIALFGILMILILILIRRKKKKNLSQS